MISPEDAATIRTRARVGLVLKNKWRIESLLGVGGMAAVYVATHVNNGRRVAIKMLHPELSMNTELRTRFLREGYVANRIAHSGAVAILDDDVAEDGSVYLVMELLEGETIETRRLRKGGTLEPNEILSICDQVLAVLAAAHDKGVVHRDVKPDNIFLTKEGGVKLLDFGIARMRELTQATATMTGSGAMGTPAFMPPEQARGRKDSVGPRTDVWALGATMYTLATGRCVHEAETLNELLLAAMTKPAPALATVASVAQSMPPPFCALIDRALAYEIDQRWADAGAMQYALREAYQAMAASDGPSTNRGIGKSGVEERSGMMPAGALITGPRPPPEFTPPPFKVSDAVRDAVNRLPPQNDPSTTSGVVFPSTSSGAFGSPGYAPGYSPIAAPPPGMVGVQPAFASHATAQPVALGTTRPARNRGVGIAVVAAGAFTFAAAFGVYILLRGDATPPSSEVASAAPSTVLPVPAPAPASTASPVESAAAEEAPSAEPSATAVASAAQAPTPAASTAAPIQRPVVAPNPRPRPWLRPSTSPSAVPSAGKQRDLSNRHN